MCNTCYCESTFQCNSTQIGVVRFRDYFIITSSLDGSQSIFETSIYLKLNLISFLLPKISASNRNNNTLTVHSPAMPNAKAQSGDSS